MKILFILMLSFQIGLANDNKTDVPPVEQMQMPPLPPEENEIIPPPLPSDIIGESKDAKPAKTNDLKPDNQVNNKIDSQSTSNTEPPNLDKNHSAESNAPNAPVVPVFNENLDSIGTQDENNMEINNADAASLDNSIDKANRMLYLKTAKDRGSLLWQLKRAKIPYTYVKVPGPSGAQNWIKWEEANDKDMDKILETYLK